jgi:hypothetical protein
LRERERESKKIGYKLFKVSFCGKGMERRGKESVRPSLQDLNNGLVGYPSLLHPLQTKEKRRGERRGEFRV